MELPRKIARPLMSTAPPSPTLKMPPSAGCNYEKKEKDTQNHVELFKGGWVGYYCQGRLKLHQQASGWVLAAKAGECEKQERRRARLPPPPSPLWCVLCKFYRDKS